MSGGVDRFDLEPAGVELLAVAEDDLDLVVELGRAVGVGDQRRVAELGSRLGEAGDVVAVRVGDEDVGDLDPVALGPLQQRPQVVVAVDQDAGAAAGVGDQVGVRQPHRVLGPLDDHCSSSLTGVVELVVLSAPKLNHPMRCRRGAAFEQRPRDQLGVVPGGRVADAGEDEEAGAGGAAVRPSAGRAGGRARTRRSSPARPWGSRRGRRRGCASPGWRRRSPRRRASRAPARAPRRAGSAPGGRRSTGRRRGASAGSAGRAREGTARDLDPGRAAQQHPRAAARGFAERARPEAGGGEGRDRGRPAEAAHFQRHPAAERVAGDVRALDPVRAGTPRARRGRGSRAVASSSSGSGGVAPKPGMSTACTSRSPSSSGITGSQMLRVPPSPWISSSCSLTARPASRTAPARRRSAARGSPPPRRRGRSPRGGGSARRSRGRAAAPRRRRSARASRPGSAGSGR